MNSGETNQTFMHSIEEIIDTYPKYYAIFKRYFKGENVKSELDDIYKPLFTNTILPNYYELMINVKIIYEYIEKKYGKDTSFSILDYLEFIFGNILYETFLYEFNKIPEKNVNSAHLAVFHNIILVESFKFEIYKEVVVGLDIESKFTPIMVRRSYNCELKISLSLKIIKSFKKKIKDTEQINMLNQMIKECDQLIKDNEIELRMKQIANSKSFIKLGY